WHLEPTFRGTFSILSSCMITIALCVWTAVHLNIPEPGQHGWLCRQNRRKVFWLVLGMFAPGVIAWVAFQQGKEASRTLSEMRQMFRQEERPRRWWPLSNSKRLAWKEKSSTYNREEWTMSHSFYALMGGLAVDIKDWRFLTTERYKQITLTIEGLEWIATHTPELIPVLSETQIQDKSKANGLAKFLVCVQTTWFYGQCITLLVQGLTISLLELNTFAHAICTLLNYIFWWHKPLDVAEPTIIQ
ncbi:hypothetical protein K458DRAFT_279966, partial [Lentithecium fluviatile CBS 122367]